MFHTIKQLEEKNVANEIVEMVWSNRMDLVAFSNTKGEVALHRLTWTRAWSLPPPTDKTKINGLSWRPDGKVLAVVYSPGNVILVDIETKNTLTSFEIPGEISFISWIQEKAVAKPKDVYKLGEEEVFKIKDTSKPYLRDPPQNIEGTPGAEETKGLSSFLQSQSEFNILVIGTREGSVYLKVFGCWTCLVFDVAKHLNQKCSVQNIHFTEDLSNFFVTVVNENNDIDVAMMRSGIFKTHTKELQNVTVKYIKLYELLIYLEKVLTSIRETWENILLTVDNKLSNYASKVPEGGVTADFLDLLMTGNCSEQMQEFLIHDLTKKGLEKFGQTMELSYSNIQTYLFRHIIKFSQNGTYHLANLKGMALFKDRYGFIGLEENAIQDAIRSNAAFMMKAGEMQQIINESVISYKAFFRWVYGAILHLMDEPLSADIQKMTQQDLACITEFLQNFDHYGKDDSNGSKFVMERLGQYLLDAPLKIRCEGNDWTEFLSQNECLKHHPCILTPYDDKSLVQCFNELKLNVDKLFEVPLNNIQQQISCACVLKGFNFDTRFITMSSINISNEVQLFSFLKSNKFIYLLEIHVGTDGNSLAKCGKFYFYNSGEDEESNDHYKIVDTKFYNSSILSILLEDATNLHQGIILQFSIPTALEYLVEFNITEVTLNLENKLPTSVNGYLTNPKIIKNIDMSVSKFAVSGSRRVSIVLSENKKKIKLFEMEGEEEDEEDTEMSIAKQNSSSEDSE